jgi:hypothetical protein
MKKPRKWCLPLTYPPKIQAVREGRCNQTIRAGWSKQVGDQVAFHGWAGTPRHSLWSWRAGYWPLVEVIDLLIIPSGIIYQDPRHGPIWYAWIHPLLEELAQRDFVDPPTGKELRRILLGMHKVDKLNGSPFQILRWRP